MERIDLAARLERVGLGEESLQLFRRHLIDEAGNALLCRDKHWEQQHKCDDCQALLHAAAAVVLDVINCGVTTAAKLDK